jgi:hypothetical protein
MGRDIGLIPKPGDLPILKTFSFRGQKEKVKLFMV